MTELNGFFNNEMRIFRNPVDNDMNNQIACTNMVTQQLRTGNVANASILELYRVIARDAFVPSAFQSFAYSDLQLPLPHQQRMMSPLEEALLLQTLQLQGHETVLEVGTGTGFLTALLSRLCHKVISVDYYADFTNEAHSKLAKYQCNNVELFTGDASQGWINSAPYDIILFTSAMEAVTDTHRLQLQAGGKLFAIVGKGPLMQAQIHRLSSEGVWQEERIFTTQLPPLLNSFNPRKFLF